MPTITEINEMEEKDITAVLEKENVDYHEYIQSRQWKARAEKAKVKAGYRCQLCHISGYARQLNVHHNNYYHLGNELDTDLVVLCVDCHKLFHDSGMKVSRKVKLSKDEFSLVLKNAGVTYNNNDPYFFYDLGKTIIRHINDEWDPDIYDYYNSVNISILYAAVANEAKRRYQAAKESEDWEGYYYESNWRQANEYWEGWE